MCNQSKESRDPEYSADIDGSKAENLKVSHHHRQVVSSVNPTPLAHFERYSPKGGDNTLGNGPRHYNGDNDNKSTVPYC
ncbi:hypothetical protein TNCV_3250481 [Trichonephila clavipes]|nr:hypothetical protein TNCV_3250481 [Trichonephila clavipes]